MKRINMGVKLACWIFLATTAGMSIQAQVGGTSGKTVSIVNQTDSANLTVYMGFVGNNLACYTSESFSSVCKFNTSNPYVCQMTVSNSGSPLVLNFNQSCQVSVAFTADNLPWGLCPTSLAEFTLNGGAGDTVDVSLVNGINYKININAIGANSETNVIDMGKAVSPYNATLGVYPPGCDLCALSQSPPTWTGCPGKQPQANCQAGTQYDPQPGCQITRPTNSDSYSVIFTDVGGAAK